MMGIEIWIIYATSAAVLWGVSYTVSEQVMRHFSIPSVLLSNGIASIVLALVIGLAGGGMQRDWLVFKKFGGETRLALASAAIYIVANAFILLATKSKNATLAGMIEITYPFFTALFAWLLFKEVQVTPGTLFGFLLTLSGVACVYYFGKNI